MYSSVLQYPFFVSVTDKRSLSKTKTSATLELEAQSRKIRATHKITFFANVPGKRSSITSDHGLISVQNCPRSANRDLTLEANRSMDIFSHKPSNALPFNFSPYGSSFDDHRQKVRSRSSGTRSRFHCARPLWTSIWEGGERLQKSSIVLINPTRTQSNGGKLFKSTAKKKQYGKTWWEPSPSFEACAVGAWERFPPLSIIPH